MNRYMIYLSMISLPPWVLE